MSERKKPPLVLENVLHQLKFIRNKRQEYFLCISLDSGGQVIKRRTVTIGLLDMSLAHPREVFAGPIKDRAARIVVAHNHPSGDPSPSDADITMTQKLVAAGILLGIALDDHIIIAKTEHYSFRTAGLL